FVNHGLITVNGKRLSIPSYHIVAGDVIGVMPNKVEIELFKEVKQTKATNLPKWLEFTPEKLEGKVIALPTREDIDANIQEHMIVELYSK
ncbi:MAG: S4 domain-containing protein, partial [Clostridia bacterium]